MKPYCTQSNGDCSTCSLVSYNRDCQNNPMHGGKRPGAGAKKQTPPDAKRHNLLLTDTEYSQVKEFVKKIREEKKNES